MKSVCACVIEPDTKKVLKNMSFPSSSSLCHCLYSNPHSTLHLCQILFICLQLGFLVCEIGYRTCVIMRLSRVAVNVTATLSFVEFQFSPRILQMMVEEGKKEGETTQGFMVNCGSDSCFAELVLC